MQGFSSPAGSPGPLSFPRSAPFLRNLWQPLRLGHNFTKHNIGFLYEREVQHAPMDSLFFFPSRVESLRSAHLPFLTVIVLHPHSRCPTEGHQSCWWGCPTMPQRGDYLWKWSKAAISETSLWTERLVSACLFPQLCSFQEQVQGCMCFHLKSVTFTTKLILL